ncbi:hypothetical protein BST81_17260 [Leptolyngbya sp. 'hensonii']|uniref:CheR family methyltransferase n=1 Tax=Leptolyngbya sp. 'hensonii' TaxID=1922337 RepID=UPI0009502C77|nr:CheR family methyltransferase [Leptolyngbya sp. 'hensonii']OLP17104.1 hypothetical protein BST81_17260 [Leptolyngbya sp. 'hensonii']
MQNTLGLPFSQLIARTLGLRVDAKDWGQLWGKIKTRTTALSLPSQDSYYQFLASGQGSASVKAEWQELASLITIGESYFLRDQGQFGLLRRTLLPDLIHRQQTHPHPSLRLWSAGCSTGEEAYSLAILLREVVPNLSAWSISILGTDINPAAIDRAERGIYSDWSFRLVDQDLRQRYFQPHREGWEIAPELRDMVTFQVENLVQQPDSGKLHSNIDVILCRNVFIYFDPAAIAATLKTFYDALRPDGYLITGHTELQGQRIHLFAVRSFSESIVYQKSPADETIPTPELKVALPTPAPTIGLETAAPLPSAKVEDKTPETLFQQLESLVAQQSYSAAIHTARTLLLLEPQHLRGHCLLAQIYANLGDHQQAVMVCQQALQFHPLSVEPCYLLAQIAEEQGDVEQAMQLLRRIIYLAPEAVMAYLELGSLHQRLGNEARAIRNWRSALDLLHHMPQDRVIEPQGTFTVKELQTQVEKSLQNYGIPTLSHL